MKKAILFAMVIGLVCSMAMPVVAEDRLSLSGTLRVRGLTEVDVDTSILNAKTNAWMDQRLRVSPSLTVNDNVKILARLDILDGHVFGTADAPGTAAGSLDWDRAWMSITSNFGKFEFGRMSGGAFGTSFSDSAGDADRLKYTYAAGDLTLLAIFQKVTERDLAVNGGVPITSSEDRDLYILAPIYKWENVTGGLLFVYNHDDATGDRNIAAAANEFVQRSITLNPYAVANFGALRLQGEAVFVDGERDFDSAAIADPDIESQEFNFEIGYTMGPFAFEAGYAFASGDSNGTADNKIGNAPGFGADWEKLWILTGTTGNVGNAAATGGLGGVGNLADGTGNTNGAKMFYLGATYQITDAVRAGVKVGSSQADDVAAGVNDDHGTEFNANLTWNLMDNLVYSANFAFLDAGDYWKTQGAIGNANFEEDVFVYHHQLQVSF